MCLLNFSRDPVTCPVHSIETGRYHRVPNFYQSRSRKFIPAKVQKIAFLLGIVATGGADAPEDVFGGLEATMDLNWKSRNRIIFHIADSPQHGARYGKI